MKFSTFSFRRQDLRDPCWPKIYYVAKDSLECLILLLLLLKWYNYRCELPARPDLCGAGDRTQGLLTRQAS